MVQSPLTNVVYPHHNKLSSRNGQTIRRVLPHHHAATGDGGLNRLLNAGQQASANYIILSNGSIGVQVPEEYRAWTSGSAAIDEPSITYEIQNSTGQAYGNDDHPQSWQISPAAQEAVVRLTADIARRYGWSSLNPDRWVMHRQFSQTACPGGFLLANRQNLINRTNNLLNANHAPSAPAPSGPYVPDPHWRVDPGDTLSKAAQHFGVTVERIARYNGIPNPNNITVGERIWPPNGWGTWHVRPGETLFSIVKYFQSHGHKNITVQKLQNANGINNPVTETKVGMRLQVPL